MEALVKILCDHRVTNTVLGVLKKQNRYRPFIGPNSDLNRMENFKTNLEKENISGQVEGPSQDRHISEW